MIRLVGGEYWTTGELLLFCWIRGDGGEGEREREERGLAKLSSSGSAGEWGASLCSSLHIVFVLLCDHSRVPTFFCC